MVTAATLPELLASEKIREQELEEARIIQGAMLPGQPLHTDPILISHEFQPVAEVGGDYLDYFVLADGTIGLYIGDVSGKGLPAALYAALAVGTPRCSTPWVSSPGEFHPEALVEPYMSLSTHTAPIAEPCRVLSCQ